jgi:CxxC motif-containing protein (DUF1111 family)
LRIAGFALVFGLGTVQAGCGGDGGSETEPHYTLVSAEPTDVSIAGLSEQLKRTFVAGDASFEELRRETQGLGPVYIRRSCGSCHREGLRGPGRVQKMVLLDEQGAPAADQSGLAYGETVRPYATAGGKAAVDVPDDDADLLVTTRLPPSVLGRGYMEAVLDSEIERMEREQAQRTDGISGRINRVTYESALNPGDGFHALEPGQTNVIGRFGLKAIIPTLDDFAARAFLLDIGLTSPLRPHELPNPDGLGDDDKPGVDLTLDAVQVTANYVRMLAIPKRGEGSARGKELFTQIKCAVCHVPSLHTRKDYPIPELADIDAPVYTDFLLHDRGPSAQDGLTEGTALPSEWRTAPLIGLRFFSAYLHDGSAKSVAEVIGFHLAPGSETKVAADLFYKLSPNDQAELIRFVESL